MPLQRTQCSSSSRVPQLDRVIEAPRGECPAIRRKCDGVHDIAVTFERSQFLATCNVPDFYRAAEIPGNNCPAVRRERNGAHIVVGTTLQYSQLLSTRDIP